MYVTSHIVKSPENKEEAIHSFLHTHGKIPWPKDVAAWPEKNPGTLVGRKTSLKMGGNAVRAYLDILCADGTSLAKIGETLADFRADLGERRNPTVFRSRKVTIRFGVEISLEDRRADVLADLEREARGLLDKQPGFK